MALKVFDGFDHYGTQADMQARGQGNRLQWSDIPAGQITFVPGRGGYGNAAAVHGSNEGSVGVGCSFNQNYTAGATPAIAVLVPIAGGVTTVDYMLMDYTNNAVQLCLRCNLNSGIVTAYAGDPNLGPPYSGAATLIASSPPNAFSPYVWNKIEVYGLMATGTGAFNMQVNGNSVLSATNVSTVCPAGQLAAGLTANNWLNGFKVRFSTGGVPCGYLDDFNLTDSTTGPGTYPCNGFLGDCATRTQFATANGTVAWTPLTSTNWVEISEVAFDGDTSYNFATTVGQTDTFLYGALPTTVSAVFGVQVTGAYRKLDASNQTIVQGLISGGTSSAGATWSMSLNYTYDTDLFVLDPHTGATWTPAAVNSLYASYTLNS